ncbi:carboxymuconolactone decarboxylase family protein [Actinosynnema sp. NPDC051121]
MQARMNHPAAILPGTMEALLALGKTATGAGLSESLMELVNLRASQINGCGVCVDMHWKALRKGGESDERIFSVSAWRDAPYYTEAERAALALAEAVTRLSDRPDPVPDDVWAEVASHYDEQQLSALLVAIATVNVWNRLNAATRQVAGAWG